MVVVVVLIVVLIVAVRLDVVVAGAAVEAGVEDDVERHGGRDKTLLAGKVDLVASMMSYCWS